MEVQRSIVGVWLEVRVEKFLELEGFGWSGLG